ncbi:ATP-dependent RNA helicase DbpA [Psychromonas sp. psych-6C06]|uniref:ATP-dependent RNA helicase DbpA n=1 Tax=Psychromonas sp. psych-6C06 TaxID=2058089 RepID=UPI000C341543|nr:ATP-dependent RNA helicase DbpA [Psychromonas sp. psych-6C06]PKF63702.1 ATP-dependent RNA helicase DbpA [Psychromonas sp. psych-6C06]
MSQQSFTSLALHSDLISNLESLGYHEMTEIQAQSLPPILAGQDIIAQGKTGSGKTAAFGLGLLQKLNVKRFRVQSLILCPTRELADQVGKEIRRLARGIHNIKVLTLCGGMPFGPQIGSLEHGAHIVVGTPGRIEDHLRKQTLSLENVETLILDEADRMLDMGFQDAIDNIIEQAPKNRQTLLFSATYPDQIDSIAKRILNSPVSVKVESKHDNSSINQYFYKVANHEDRMLALRLLLLQYQPESSVVFCNTKREVQEVNDELVNRGFSAIALHGDLEQKDRDQALIRFANKSATILVATDVAARGLDIDNLSAVFNFHIAHDQEVHVHRIGRTGRAGNKGLAFSFYSSKDTNRIIALEDYLDITINEDSLPSHDVLDIKPPQSTMITMRIEGGKKQKIRPGDIVGALTADKSMTFEQIGKIQVSANWAYVAVQREVIKVAFKKLSEGKLKGRKFRVMVVRG